MVVVVAVNVAAAAAFVVVRCWVQRGRATYVAKVRSEGTQ